MEDEVEDDEVEDDDVNREEDDDVENDNVEEEEEYDDDDVGDDDVEEEDRSQDLDPHFVRACAVETHVKISQEPLDMEIYRKNAAAQIEPRTQTNTLCEPAQSKRLSRFHKSHFIIRKFSEKMPWCKTVPQTLIMRACAVKTHVEISEESVTSYGNLQVKCRRPKPRRRLCASPRSRNACQHFTRGTFSQKFTGKMLQTKAVPQTLCDPAQSKRTSRFHKSHFTQKFTGKMPQATLNPERGRILCASLRNRNACQDFTRATLY